jgi:hypothetical protein
VWIGGFWIDGDFDNDGDDTSDGEVDDVVGVGDVVRCSSVGNLDRLVALERGDLTRLAAFVVVVMGVVTVGLVVGAGDVGRGGGDCLDRGDVGAGDVGRGGGDCLDRGDVAGIGDVGRGGSVGLDRGDVAVSGDVGRGGSFGLVTGGGDGDGDGNGDRGLSGCWGTTGEVVDSGDDISCSVEETVVVATDELDEAGDGPDDESCQTRYGDDGEYASGDGAVDPEDRYCDAIHGDGDG